MTVRYLQEKSIPFTYYEIEEQPEDVIKKVINANGGEDWVVPTLEYNGKWREGMVFKRKSLEKDLKELGIKF